MNARSLINGYRCIGCTLGLPHRGYIQFPQFPRTRAAYGTAVHAARTATTNTARLLRTAAARTRDEAHFVSLLIRDAYSRTPARVYTAAVLLAVLGIILNGTFTTNPSAQWIAGLIYGAGAAMGWTYWTIRSPRSRYAAK